MAQPLRIGALIPEGNLVCETEFPRLAPDGASFHYQRLARQGTALTAQSLLTLHETIGPALDALRLAAPQAYVFACTSGTFLAGADRHDDAAARIREATGRAAITTASALLQACEALRVGRLCMLTPYPDDITREEVEFLGAHGVDASRSEGLGCADGDAIRGLSEVDVRSFLLRSRELASGCDAVFLSCTNLPTLGLIEDFERECGFPVFSSNTATAWAGLRLAGVDEPIAGMGSLGRLRMPGRRAYQAG